MMSQLPIVGSEKPVECHGCGVCCFHMGYPAFILPQEPRTEAEIEQDPDLRRLAEDSSARKRLLAGVKGEEHWFRLPENLKRELEEFVRSYTPPLEGELDPPCFWLDEETRLCKHHEYRPRVCRDFEIGSSQCLEWRKVYEDRIQMNR